ncbi:hypothetical protein B296_00020481 [Ensete ventricosum]|uniref:RING-type domain-containing protein n=1 Tax=Ensete ventricosum TaxID=4639 RepID=A0A426ZBU4_ENSVE|nr:hypothetical protein B296_00020481 [Ensete ventricosum]
MGRVAHGLIARSLLRRNLAPPHFSSSSSSSAAAVAAQRTVPIASSCGTASDVATCPRPRWRLFSLPVAPSRSVSVGLAGALSFSLTLVTTAGAKEPPSPELIPKDVVLYQYEACPFCNKVKGNFSMTERFTVKYAGAAIMYMSLSRRRLSVTETRAGEPPYRFFITDSCVDPASVSPIYFMAIQAPLPFFYSSGSSLDGMMEGGGRLPSDPCQSFQPQLQQMAMMPWPPLCPPPPPTSTTGSTLLSSWTSGPCVSMDPSRHLIQRLLEKQGDEIDLFLRQQSDTLVAELRQQAKRHTAAMVRSLQSKASFLLGQREEELAKANKVGLELELRLKSAEEDRARWQIVAMENEAIAIALHNTLEQVREPCLSTTNGVPTEEAAAPEATAGMSSTTLGRCRVCGHRDACVVLLPCSHLCCCAPCASFLEGCPLCSSVKRGSVEVFWE